MARITEIKQQGPQVRAKNDSLSGVTVSGKLVGHKSGGFVVLHNSLYKVYDAALHNVANISAAQWPANKGKYSSCC